ncbi:MAG: hypothetical protein R2826_08965 [Thermoleophilia bacterium]
MARTSKVALLAATALALLAVLIGPTVAGAQTSSISASTPRADVVFTATNESPSGDTTWGENAAPTDQSDRGQGMRGPALDRNDSTLRTGHDAYWSVGEILQWVAIALLAGLAAALAIWRPWRHGTGPAAAATAPTAPVAYDPAAANVTTPSAEPAVPASGADLGQPDDPASTIAVADTAVTSIQGSPDGIASNDEPEPPTPNPSQAAPAETAEDPAR